MSLHSIDTSDSTQLENESVFLPKEEEIVIPLEQDVKSNLETKMTNLELFKESLLSVPNSLQTKVDIFDTFISQKPCDRATQIVEFTLQIFKSFLEDNENFKIPRINLLKLWDYIEQMNNSVKRFPIIIKSILKNFFKFHVDTPLLFEKILKREKKNQVSVLFFYDFLSTEIPIDTLIIVINQTNKKLIEAFAEQPQIAWLRIASKKFLLQYEQSYSQLTSVSTQEYPAEPKLEQPQTQRQEQPKVQNFFTQAIQTSQSIEKPKRSPPRKQGLMASLRNRCQNKGNEKKPVIIESLDEILTRITIEYKFSKFSNNQKLITIREIVEALQRTSPEEIQQGKLNCDIILSLCQVTSPCGIDLVVKILSIFIKECHEKKEINLQKYLQKIILEIIKNSRTTWRVVVASVKDLFDLLNGIEKFNSILFSTLLEGLTFQGKPTEPIFIELASHVLRKEYFKDNMYYLDSIIHRIASIHANDHNSHSQKATQNILIELQSKMGDKILSYLKELNFWQLRALNQLTNRQQKSKTDISLSEKELNKITEIEWMLNTCVNSERLETLFDLIEKEMNFYRYGPREYNLRYNVMFSYLLGKKLQSAELQKKVFQLIKRFNPQFKPSEKANLFDTILNIQSKHITSELRASVLIEFTKELGIEFFYTRIVGILEQNRRKQLSSVILLLRWAIKQIRPIFLTEIAELLINSVSINEQSMNNQIFNLLAHIDIVSEEGFLNRIINTHSERPAYIQKKIEGEKTKITLISQKKTRCISSFSDIISIQGCKEMSESRDFSLLSALQEEDHHEIDQNSQFSVIIEDSEKETDQSNQ